MATLMRRLYQVALSLGLLASSPAHAACEDGHWITEVMNDGAVIELEDGSLWLVDEIDQISTMLWLPVTNIVACDGMLINTDDGEKVGAHKIR